jgi:hypothetical protein
VERVVVRHAAVRIGGRAVSGRPKVLVVDDDADRRICRNRPTTPS